MASLGQARFREITNSGQNINIGSHGTDVFWSRDGITAYGISTRELTLTNVTLSRTITITKPVSFAFPEISDFTLPPQLTLTIESTTATERVYRFTTDLIIRDTTHLIPIYFSTTDMSFNIRINREGVPSLTSAAVSPTSVPAGGNDAGRTVTITAVGEIGARYNATAVLDDGTSLTVSNGSNVQVPSTGVSPVSPTFIVPANTGNVNSRGVLVTLTNTIDSTDQVIATVVQSGDTAIQLAPAILNDRTDASVSHAFHDAALVARATISAGVGPFQVKYFRQDPSITTIANFDSAPTTNQIGSTISQSGASFTGNIDSSGFSATRLGSNTFWVVVRGSAGVQTETVTIDVSQATYLTAQLRDTRWFEGNTTILVNGTTNTSRTTSDTLVNDSDITITHTGTGATSTGLRGPGIGGTQALSASDNRLVPAFNAGHGVADAVGTTTLTITGPATTVTNATNVFATQTVTRLQQNSTVSNGATYTRDFNDTSASAVVAQISNFPTSTASTASLGTLIRGYSLARTPSQRSNLHSLGFGTDSPSTNTATFTLVYPSTSPVGIGIVGNTVVVRMRNISGSTLAGSNVKALIDDEYYVRGVIRTAASTGGGIVTFIIDSNDPIFSSLTNADSIDSLTDIDVEVSYISDSGNTSGRAVAIDIGGNDFEIGGVTPTFQGTTPAGWTASYSAPSLNTSVTAANSLQVPVEYFNVTIGNILVTQSARPKVAQQLMEVTTALTTTPPINIDDDAILDVNVMAASGSTIDVWVLHDTTDSYQNTTDGSGADFINLTATQTSTAIPSAISGFPSTLTTVTGSSVENVSNVYGALTRIRYETSAAATSTDITNDTICINIT